MAAQPLWRISPKPDFVGDRLWLGPRRDGEQTGLFLGRLGELIQRGTVSVWLSTSKEQVTAVVGKRGSGKSFTLGVIAEGLCTQAEQLVVGEQNRGILLFDPLDVYWPLRYPVAESSNTEAQRHYELAQRWGVIGGTFKVTGWVPGGGLRPGTDPGWFKALHLRISDLGPAEWEVLLDSSVATSPLGQALMDCVHLVAEAGYEVSGKKTGPCEAYDFRDLEAALRSDEMSSEYHTETVRALRQRLRALVGMGLFSAEGTAIEDLVQGGTAAVILLGRLPQSYRTVVVSTLVRQLMEARIRSAFEEKRVVLDPTLESDERATLRERVATGIPRTHVLLDEAQVFLAGQEGRLTVPVFRKLAKEGRNIGLSLVVATQQPSAIDAGVLSQVETFVSHQLVTETDIQAVRSNMKAALPDGIEFGKQEMSFSDMLRGLKPGQCYVSASDTNLIKNRGIVVNVRPRASVHGGIEL